MSPKKTVSKVESVEMVFLISRISKGDVLIQMFRN